MKIRIISFTENGARLGAKLEESFLAEHEEAEASVRFRHAEEGAFREKQFEGSLKDWTKEAFAQADALIFIGAAGIAVRHIAPLLKDKYHDPAVVVIDEGGRYAVSLLSGHVGGANELARRAADILGAQPVITTATDTESAFAVDLFAKKNGLAWKPAGLLKEVSAAVLRKETVGLSSRYPLQGDVPGELTLLQTEADEEAAGRAGRDIPAPASTGAGQPVPELGISISALAGDAVYRHTLRLIPRTVWLGIGCRRGVPEDELRDAAEDFLRQSGIFPEAVAGIASIDIKADEAGLKGLAAAKSLPFLTFSAEQLRAAEGEFACSEFVQSRVGVDNVCERAAVCAAGTGGRLIARRQVYGHHITIAAAEAAFTAVFS